MKYLWTEDSGAGLHFWQLANRFLLGNELTVESKGSNQGLLDAVRELEPDAEDYYYIAFDIVYDNMDVTNKYLELRQLVKKYPDQIVLLDITCFEYLVFCFEKLIEWTGAGKKDKIEMRKHILYAMKNHKIDISQIEDSKTINYLMGYKHFSTEKVIKSLTYELTENDKWSVKGARMGDCWFEDCCVLADAKKAKCSLDKFAKGNEKIHVLFNSAEIQRVLKPLLI